MNRLTLNGVFGTNLPQPLSFFLFLLLLLGYGTGALADYTKGDANGRALPDSATTWACVQDNSTGLIWENKIQDSDTGLHHIASTYAWFNPDSNTNGGFSGEQNGEGNCLGSSCDTYSYVQTVNTQGFCGGRDWRMPTLKELEGLIDTSGTIPLINPIYFPDVSADHVYWTGSPVLANSELAYAVSFTNGTTETLAKNSAAGVLLVRKGRLSVFAP